MKKIYMVLFVLFVSVLLPYQMFAQSADVFRQEGIASWYGDEFNGRLTASGEVFNSSLLTAAHPTLPFGTRLVVTNLHNKKKVTVKVTDRGPFVAARIIDVSKEAAKQLDMIITGTAPVLIESVEKVALPSLKSTTPVIKKDIPPVDDAYSIQPAAAQLKNAPQLEQAAQTNTHSLKLTPQINIIPAGAYRLQLGSYRTAANAVIAFEKLKQAGLNPAYEQSGDYYRVVLAGVSGSEMQSVAEKVESAGFKEALIREER